MSQTVYAASDVAMGVDQEQRITGVVKDANGEPMIGVTVMVKGTATGAITDIDGNYSVSVSGSKSVLTFSFVGYTTKEVTVGNQKVINVILEDCYNLLRHRRFGRKSKNEVMIWQPYLFLRFAVSCFHCHSS